MSSGDSGQGTALFASCRSRRPDSDGYTALQVTFGNEDLGELNKPEAGHFEKAGVAPGTKLVELRIDDVSTYCVGEDHRRHTAARGLHRCHGRQPRQGIHRRDEAPRFQGSEHITRQPQEAPSTRVRRAVCDPIARVPWTAHGRSFRWRKVTTLNLQVVRTDLDNGLLLVPRRGARPSWRHRRCPRRSEGRSLMATLTVTTTSSAGAGTVEVSDKVFAIEPNKAVLHQVVTAQLAARRSGTQSTLTRGEVRGGGIKPWRQKGTGRARQGSIRSPQSVGGGHPRPKPRSYAQRTPKKMVRLALASALSDRVSSERVLVVDWWDFTQPKTKDALKALSSLGATGRVLIVLTLDDESAWKSFRNIPSVHVLSAGELNAYDISSPST